MTMNTLSIPVSERDHVAGSLDAPVILVEYGDFECPFCGQAYPIVKAMQRHFGKELAFVFRNFPLRESHPHAQLAAQAAEAAGSQGKFWEMHDTLYENQRALEEKDLVGYATALGLDVTRFEEELRTGVYAKKVRDDFRGGVRSGVNGTPTFFINGVRFDGNWGDPEEFTAALADAATSRQPS